MPYYHDQLHELCENEKHGLHLLMIFFFHVQRPEDRQEVARAGHELNQEVNRLMVAMRDMLANIQFREPQWEDNQDRDEEEWD